MQEDRRAVHGRAHRQSRKGVPSPPPPPRLFVIFVRGLVDAFGGQMLDDLVIAVESETQVVDIGRVSGFMQKVKPESSPSTTDRFT